MSAGIEFRWLGTAGIELKVGDHVLVIDPYLTRFPLRRLWFGRVHPDQELIRAKIQKCDHVLVTHAHFDHIMDVPEVMRCTGATALGSANSCRLLQVCGVSTDKIREMRAGDRLVLDDFEIEARRAEHLKTPGFRPGPLAGDLEPPLRARDYRMDECFSFLISVDGLRLLTDPGMRHEDGVAADVLLVHPNRQRGYYRRLLEIVEPRVVIPLHWDDFTRPLSEGMRPTWRPPAWAWPPLQRVDLAEFRRTIAGLAPGARVLEPEVWRPYSLEEYL